MKKGLFPAMTLYEITDQGRQTFDALHRAWLSEDVAQCGYCQPGQLMTAAALLKRNPDPDDGDAISEAMSGVLCQVCRRVGTRIQRRDWYKRLF